MSDFEKNKILEFFGVEAKKRLKKKPDYFKVVLTARVEVPSGFHQIRLTGLDQSESRQLMNTLYARYQHGKSPLTEEQKDAIHKASGGIPIVIKHCIGQVYEYNESLDAVLRKLKQVSSDVVQFSFAEVFRLLKEDETALRIMILLGLVRGSLLIRQIADVLELDEREIERKVPALLSFQCIDRFAQGRLEKYKINDEVRFLTTGLAQEHAAIEHQIRRQLAVNFSVDRQMDYTSEELGILVIFNNYLSEKQFLQARDYIQDQLKERPDSILLNFNYARYLKEQDRDFNAAIKILEEIRQRSHDHPSILRLLVSCFMSLDVPNYQAASAYVQALEGTSLDNEMKIDIAGFYVQWSTSIKIRAPFLDPLQEMIRQRDYKELADKAIAILKDVPAEGDQVCYLLGQCYYNKWDNPTAFTWINKALALVDPESTRRENYWRFRGDIIRKANERGDRLADSRDDAWYDLDERRR